MRRFLSGLSLLVLAASSSAAAVDDSVLLAFFESGELVIARASPRGVAILHRQAKVDWDGAAWIDARTLVTKVTDDAGNTSLTFYVDGVPDKKRAVTVPHEAWGEVPLSTWLFAVRGRPWLRACTAKRQDPISSCEPRYVDVGGGAPFAATDRDPGDAMRRPADPAIPDVAGVALAKDMYTLAPWRDDRTVRMTGVVCTSGGATARWPDTDDWSSYKIERFSWVTASPPILALDVTYAGGLGELVAERRYYRPCTRAPVDFVWLGKDLFAIGDPDKKEKVVHHRGVPVGKLPDWGDRWMVHPAP